MLLEPFKRRWLSSLCDVLRAPDDFDRLRLVGLTVLVA